MMVIVQITIENKTLLNERDASKLELMNLKDSINDLKRQEKVKRVVM